ncbi:hypothetical protein RV15_GL000496 [Enterococcus silesiacus]|uniref:Uncharacterized protein n=1 Tax=Enterococcus silesiacus TaxID=332949 RepID=A0AA91JPF2_9ENTE|nr:hypothetical protein RV15_GL000496 [Enterococcus silesiacus]
MNNSFNRETQRPSLVKEWQIPAVAVLPIEPFRVLFITPLLEHETSYFADSARISIFLDKSIPIPHF